MGLIIKASSLYEGKDNQGSVDLAVQAAKICIESSNIDIEDIGILINIGIYREENIVEPAMAKLIQKKLRINLDPVRKNPVGKTTFCFDLINGTCGFLNAVQIVESLIKNKKDMKYALIVSSDVHPSKNKVSDFPYSHYGAAVILGKSQKKEKGFKNIVVRTSEEDNYTGVIGYNDLRKYGTSGRYNVAIDIAADYEHKLHQFTVETITKYIKSEKIDISKTLIIASHPTKDFIKEIAKSIGHDQNLMIDVYDKYGDSNSSALSIGYHVASNSILKENDQVLFVGASSGLTSACGLYIV